MKLLICFTMVFPVLTFGDMYYEEDVPYCDICECYSPCCCIPREKRCIDCECYTPKFHDLECDWGIIISGDFLYWYARETGLYYALKVTGVDTSPIVNPPGAELENHIATAPVEYRHFETKWAPGFRVGFGFNFPCDGWDLYANWTYYHNFRREKKSFDLFSVIPSPGQFGFFNPWINPAVVKTEEFSGTGVQDNLFFYQISAKWRLSFNMIDLELARKYWLSKCFVIRPYIGARGGWTKIRFSTTSLNFTIGQGGTFGDDGIRNFNGTYIDRFEDHFWGGGILGGIQPTWYLSSCIAIFGNLDASLIWGKYSGQKKEVYSGTADISDAGIITAVDLPLFSYRAKSENKFFGMQPIIDLGAGFRFEQTCGCDRARVSLDLGWEHHIWFNHTHRNKLSGRNQTLTPNDTGDLLDYFTGVCEETHDLAFGGFVLRGRIDF